jgi:SAM-dependent methyltransferase
MNREKIAAYYDSQALRKLQDFVVRNKRVERGWQLIVDCGGTPSRILEIGCGVGSICWRMSQRHPASEVIGVDFSQGNLAIAERVFKSPNVAFVLTDGTSDFQFGRFDLIVLMDVYEHVAVEERRALHANLRKSLTESGRILLTFPTPRHLAWLRANEPNEIQPVDENISPEVVAALASDVERDVLVYREVDVWRAGDYAHAVVGSSLFPAPAPRRAVGRINRLTEILGRRARLRRVTKAGIHF